MPQSTISSDLILSEKINHLYQRTQHKIVSAALFSGTLFLTFYVSNFNQINLVIVWITLLSIYIYFRFSHLNKYKKNHQDESFDFKGWAKRLSVITGYFGLIVAWFMWVFIDLSQPLEVMVIILAVMAIMFGTSSHMCAYPLAYYTFVVPCFLTPILIFTFSDNSDYQLAAIACSIFMIYLIFLTEQLHSNLDNITRYRLSQIKLVESINIEKERAESAVESKAQFFAAANHDLRQPVHAALLYLENLKLVPDLSDDVYHLVNKTDLALINLTDLLDGVLDISKIDSNTNPIQVEPILLSEFTSEWLPSFKDQALHKGLKLDCKLPGVWVQADAMMLKRIVMNLIHNAIKFTNSGYVKVTAEVKDEEVLLKIIDTGVGIQEDKLETIFDEFIQLGNTERDREKGLGLGLPICQRLARHLGSEINVISKFGYGSTFYFGLTQCPPPVSKVELSQEPLSGLDHEINNKIIWLLDNESDIVDAQEKLLRQWGYVNIRSLITLDDFEHQKEIESPDLFICDYRLSEKVNGLNIIEQLTKQTSKPFKTLILTGETDPQLLGLFKQKKIASLQKPLAPAKFRMAIQSLLK